MGLMDPSEHVLLMDLPHAGGQYIDQNDLQALRAAGVRTAIRFYGEWDLIEPQQGQYDWSSIDAYVESRLAAGFKIMLNCYTKAPVWCPADWYAWTVNGPQVGVLSPWNSDAMAYSLEFCARMRDRYNSHDVVVTNGWLSGGETIFLNEPAWYDPAAVASYQTFFGPAAQPVPNVQTTEDWLKQTYLGTLHAIQSALVQNEHKDVYLALHPAIADFQGLYGNGNKWINDVVVMLRSLGPDVNITHVYYTWVQWPYYWQRMQALSTSYGENIFGGAEYCEGAPTTAPAAAANGLQGLICAPCHPFTPHTKIEPWMLDNLIAAQQAWK